MITWTKDCTKIHRTIRTIWIHSVSPHKDFVWNSCNKECAPMLHGEQAHDIPRIVMTQRRYCLCHHHRESLASCNPGIAARLRYDWKR